MHQQSNQMQMGMQPGVVQVQDGGQMNMMAQQPSLGLAHQTSQQNSNNSSAETSASQNTINHRYKTARCRHFDNNGNCIMGDTCHFAHGQAELRDPSDPIPDHLKIHAMKRVPSGNPHQGGSQMNTSGRSSQNMNYNNPGFSQNASPNNFQSRGGQNNNFDNNRRGNFGGNFRGQGRGGANYYYANGASSRGGNMNGGQYQGRGGSSMPGASFGGRGGSMHANYRGGGGGASFGGGRGGFGGNMSNFKTVKCKYFDSGKPCPYQNKCSYAHGNDELRANPTNFQNGGGRMNGQYGPQMNSPHLAMSPQQMSQYQSVMPNQQTMFIAQPGIDQNQMSGRYPGMGNQDANSQNMSMMNAQQFMMDPSLYGQGQINNQFYQPGQGYDQQQAYAQNMLMGYQNIPQMYIAQNQIRPSAMMGQQVQNTASILINSTQDGADGQQVSAQRQIGILIYQNSQEVQDQIKLASECSDQGKSNEALQILQQLQGQGKIQMQEAGSQKDMNMNLNSMGESQEQA